MEIENKSIEIKFISENCNKYNIDFSNALFRKINKEKKGILEKLDIKYCRKIQILLFDDVKLFKKSIEKFYIKYEIPEYCKGCIQEGRVYFCVNNKLIKNTFEYEVELRKVLHEYIHILYNEYIISNNDRVIWLDEGIALNLSKEKGRFFKERFPVLNTSLIKIDLNDLNHENGTFYNERINGYDISYLTVKYLLENNNKERFNEIIRNNEEIQGIRKKYLDRSIQIF